MFLIDTHCHLDLPEFDPDRAEVIDRALAAGVGHMITVGIDPETSARAIDLARRHDCLSATVGHHPHDAAALTDPDLDRLAELVAQPEVVAFGEIGLDFYRDLSPRQIQRQRFDDLLEVGLAGGKPLILHIREAHREVLEHLSRIRHRLQGGVVHCFSGDHQMAVRFLDLGFHISFPGTLTYPKAAGLRDVAARLPASCLLIETDAPFLPPQIRRGRRNEPALVAQVAEELARVRGVPLPEVAALTAGNARTLFNLPIGEQSVGGAL